ncbi:signal peptide protein, YSIRK family [Parvimonas sp. KA00067]|uniref:YSIRK-type signal peptide-containing protein n=1 Tax=Parvimonas sp. KA00067 TaxID=1588755 RepID=UPI0007980F4A|nr:YSIRK-type signal peptide-containing protein [Parvimonas sp. KA00067]KXB64448.1 signal peptide protein, YSIRK family [Parvimonas sp. KA00067]
MKIISRENANTKQKYLSRKLSVGLVSVLCGFAFAFGAQQTNAQVYSISDLRTEIEQKADEAVKNNKISQNDANAIKNASKMMRSEYALKNLLNKLQTPRVTTPAKVKTLEQIKAERLERYKKEVVSMISKTHLDNEKRNRLADEVKKAQSVEKVREILEKARTQSEDAFTTKEKQNQELFVLKEKIRSLLQRLEENKKIGKEDANGVRSALRMMNSKAPVQRMLSMLNNVKSK